MSTTLPAPLKAAINSFQKAAERHAFKGSFDPEGRAAAIHQLQTARDALERAIVRYAKRGA